MHNHEKEGMCKFRKLGSCSGACLQVEGREAGLQLGRLRLLELVAQLQLHLLAPGVARRRRQRDLALHECNAGVSV